MRRKATLLLLLAFCGFFSSTAYAQFNLKTGYHFSVLSTPELNKLLDDYNHAQAYETPLRHLGWLHGFETGVRYKSGMHALEFTYQGASRASKATGRDAMNDTYKDKLRFMIHSLGLGYQLGDGFFGIGTDFQYQMNKVRFTSGLHGTVSKNIQYTTAFKFYFNLTFKGDTGIDLALQPYFILPTKDYDLTPLSEILQTDIDGGQDRWIRYGLTLMFYNGAK